MMKVFKFAILLAIFLFISWCINGYSTRFYIEATGVIIIFIFYLVHERVLEWLAGLGVAKITRLDRPEIESFLFKCGRCCDFTASKSLDVFAMLRNGAIFLVKTTTGDRLYSLFWDKRPFYQESDGTEWRLIGRDFDWQYPCLFFVKAGQESSIFVLKERDVDFGKHILLNAPEHVFADYVEMVSLFKMKVEEE